MNIIHLINSLGYGGAERQLALVAAEAAKAGHAQHIVPLVGVASGVAVPAGIGVATAGRPPLSVVAALFSALARIRASPRVVLVAWMYHTWPVALLAKLLHPRKVRLLLYCRHGDLRSLKHSTRLAAHIGMLLARRLKLPVVFNSRVALENHRHLARGARCLVIPNGVAIGNAPVRGGRGHSPVLAFLGRNHPDKGADLLPVIVAEVLQRVADSRFVVAGPGMLGRRDELRAAVAAAGCSPDRIDVHDAVHDTRAFLAEVDVLVIPSRAESFPNVLIEAMAAGVLVACSDAGEMPEILHGLADVADSPAGVARIACQLCALAPGQAQERRRALADAVAGRYAIPRVAEEHLGLWQAEWSHA